MIITNEWHVCNNFGPPSQDNFKDHSLYKFRDGLNGDAEMFSKYVSGVKTQLYPGCTTFIKSFIVEVFHLKDLK